MAIFYPLCIFDTEILHNMYFWYWNFLLTMYFWYWNFILGTLHNNWYFHFLVVKGSPFSRGLLWILTTEQDLYLQLIDLIKRYLPMYVCTATQRSLSKFVKLITLMFGAWGRFLTSPLGAKLDPKGWSWPPKVKFSPRGEVFPYGWSFPPEVRPFVCHYFFSKNYRLIIPGGVQRGEQSP
jgi:hypothetical protein